MNDIHSLKKEHLFAALVENLRASSRERVAPCAVGVYNYTEYMYTMHTVPRVQWVGKFTEIGK